jgi:hypothetical protein
LPEGMRLYAMSIAPTSPYTLSVTVINGDPILSPTGTCSAQYGGQFCARSQLTTVVVKRL